MRDKSLVNLEVLRLFVATVEYGSIAGSARTLDLSPSLATRKIAQLEDALTVRLFERTTRSIKLTEAGALALRWAKQNIEAHEALADDLAALQGNPSGLIRMVAAPYFAVEQLPSLITQFSERYPQIRVSISTTDRLVNLVEQQYDIAIHAGRIPDSSLIGHCLYQFERILCASPGYVKRFGEPKTPQELAAHRCLMHSTNESNNWCFLLGRQLVSYRLQPFMESDSFAVLLELARKGTGIVRLSQALVTKDIAARRLVRILPDYKCVYPDSELPGLWLLYPNRRVLHRTRLLIDFLVANLTDFSTGTAPTVLSV